MRKKIETNCIIFTHVDLADTFKAATCIDFSFERINKSILKPHVWNSNMMSSNI